MDLDPTVAPGRVPTLSSAVIRVLALPTPIVTTIAVMCLASQTRSAAAKQVSPNNESPGEFLISADTSDPDYMQDLPYAQPDREFTGMNNGRLALYYEIVMLLFPLAIAIGAIVCRKQTSTELRGSDFPRTGEEGSSQYFSDQVFR
jgi:hypothetical protein